MDEAGEVTGEAKRVRAFVALEIDPGLRSQLALLVARLQRELRGVRWMAPEAIHLTLRFFGWCAPETLDRLHEPLGQAAADCPPATVPATGLGMFPERGSPRVLWVGLTVPDSVRRLQEACEGAAVAAGFEPEPRSFQPHLTLGRWKDRVRRPALPVVPLGPTALDRLILFRSDLQPSGARYTPLAVFPLGGSSTRRGRGLG